MATAVPTHFTQAHSLQIDGGSFDAPPSRVADQGPVGTWAEVALPHVSLPRDAAPTGEGRDAIASIVTTWYRFQLESLPPGVTPQAMHLYLPRWQTIGQVAVYADGHLLFNSRGDPVWNGFNHPLWVPLAGTADARMPHTLLLRLTSARSAGGAISSVWVGTEDELLWRWRTRELLQAEVPFMASAAFLAIGLFSLAVWAFRPGESAYGLFFASSLMFFVRTLHFYIGVAPIPFPADWFGWATVNSIGWFMVTVYFFGFRLHGRTYPWIERGMIGLMGFSTLVMMPTFTVLPMAAVLAPLAYLGMLVAGIITTLAGIWAAWRARAPDALTLAVWNFGMLPLAVHDLALQSYRTDIESLYLTPYGGIGIFVIFLVIVSRRYIRAMSDVERANVHLEQSLRDREAKLAVSYERLRETEHRQTLSQERQRLMQDMHDGLGSSLMSALRMVELGHLDETDVARVLKECIDDLKLTIDSLEPVETDLLLLLATLRFRLTPRLEGADLSLRWDVQDVPPLRWLDPRSALHILRILQEAFTNAIKHSHASEIRVSTLAQDGGVLVRVTDNGRGLSSDAQTHGGKGLANLRRRAQAIGARVDWHGAAGAGTSFELWLPLQAPARPAEN